MNDVIDIIKQTILKEAQTKIVQNQDFIRIKEDAKNAVLKSVGISGFKENDKFCSFSLDLEKFKTLSNYIHRKNYNKGCDGVIVLVRNSKLYFLLCELKSNKPHKIEYENQLKSSEAFIKYLIEAVKIFDKLSLNQGSVEIIKILFSTQAKKSVLYSPNKKKKAEIKHIQCFEGNSTNIKIKELLAKG